MSYAWVDEREPQLDFSYHSKLPASDAIIYAIRETRFAQTSMQSSIQVRDFDGVLIGTIYRQINRDLRQLSFPIYRGVSPTERTSVFGRVDFVIDDFVDPDTGVVSRCIKTTFEDAEVLLRLPEFVAAEPA